MDKRTRVWQLVGLGWYVAACLMLGILGGLWLDQWLHLAPLFLLVGLAVGLAAAFWGMFRMLAALNADDAGESAKDRGKRGR